MSEQQAAQDTAARIRRDARDLALAAQRAMSEAAALREELVAVQARKPALPPKLVERLRRRVALMDTVAFKAAPTVALVAEVRDLLAAIDAAEEPEPDPAPDAVGLAVYHRALVLMAQQVHAEGGCSDFGQGVHCTAERRRDITCVECMVECALAAAEEEGSERSRTADRAPSGPVAPHSHRGPGGRW